MSAGGIRRHCATGGRARRLGASVELAPAESVGWRYAAATERGDEEVRGEERARLREVILDSD
jgi:hypothetical protein